MLKPSLLTLTGIPDTGLVFVGNYPGAWPAKNSGYSYTPSIVGGTGPYLYTVGTGAIPTGMSLNSSTGAITGTPTTGGTFNFTIHVVDSTLPIPYTTNSSAQTIIIETDAQFSSVSLLMHFDGTNADTTTADSSSNAFAITRRGTAAISNTQAKFGGTSSFIGTGSGWSAPDDVAFEFGAGSYTVEGWFYPTAATGNMNLFSKWNTNNEFLAAWQPTASPANFLLGLNNSSFPTFTGTFNLNAWNHVAIVCDGALIKFYLNGVSLGSTARVTLTDGTDVWSVGCVAANLGSSLFTGYIDEVRVTKGVQRYTSNFTPRTLPFPGA